MVLGVGFDFRLGVRVFSASGFQGCSGVVQGFPCMGFTFCGSRAFPSRLAFRASSFGFFGFGVLGPTPEFRAFEGRARDKGPPKTQNLNF